MASEPGFFRGWLTGWREARLSGYGPWHSMKNAAGTGWLWAFCIKAEACCTSFAAVGTHDALNCMGAKP